MDVWNTLHMSMQPWRTCLSISTSSRNRVATAVRASSGHAYKHVNNGSQVTSVDEVGVKNQKSSPRSIYTKPQRQCRVSAAMMQAIQLSFKSMESLENG